MSTETTPDLEAAREQRAAFGAPGGRRAARLSATPQGRIRVRAERAVDETARFLSELPVLLAGARTALLPVEAEDEPGMVKARRALSQTQDRIVHSDAARRMRQNPAVVEAIAWGRRRVVAPMKEAVARPRGGVSVRVRVLIYLTVLTGVALTVAGTTAYVIERGRIDASIESDLARKANDLVTFVEDGDPTTGEAFADAESILREAIRRVVATPSESAVALVDGVPRFIPGGSDILPIESDGELLTAALAAAGGDPEVRAISTDQADYRYVSMPVEAADGTVQGVIVYAVDRGETIAELADSFQVYAVVAILSLAAISGFGYITVGRLLEPIRLLDTTARRISTTDLSERIPIVGDDDLARLSETVNQMLDRIERAFSEQSRMLDDASHELRTPLTIMRTRLELVEPRDADSVLATRDDLLDEVSRMTRLVEDLTTLAKADRPEFLRLGAVDLADLAELALIRAETLGPRRWTLEAVAEGEVEADAERLTQAWLQLSANAVRFSEPESKVTLGSSIGVADDDHPEFRLWVRDEGIGVAPEDIARIRTRFGRASAGGEGSGLGVPIVAAIAEAHEGRLDIESTPGEGSTFTIVIPAYKPRGDQPAPESPWAPPSAAREDEA
ncbi:cell wall metabolism sensor histidine kinase WalK [Demequina sp. NBRC 110054]|uniref:sensor histidine kinase n=1 Tax=Demequina sp. NBRC 110054 TaxID=1570343 RepID=UPI0009FDB9C7|nr:ATP-binding protein [Demequina sp. NBRC 110054]